MKDSDRRQKVENWRLGEQLRGIMKAIIKKRDFKKHRRGWKTQACVVIWM